MSLFISEDSLDPAMEATVVCSISHCWASPVTVRDAGQRFRLSSVLLFLSLDPNDQKSLEGMQKMEKEESPTDATQEEDVDDMEGSGEEGDLEGSDSEAAQWADQEQWFGMQ